jgi:2'-5' RNA ligase
LVIMAGNEEIRLFVAVFPPAEVARHVSEAARGLADRLSPRSVSWTRPEQMHLTLNFLGNVVPDKVEEFEQAVEDACHLGEPHVLQPRGLGCFPSPPRPRVIWAGLAGAVSVLETLKRTLDARLAVLGYAPDARPFQPHLTIGRVKQLSGGDRRHLTDALPRWHETDFGSWTVNSVDLMQSVLSPAGAEYVRVKSFALPDVGWSPSACGGQC